MFDLKGKVALVTGSTRGIGRSIAEHMARSGAKVVISSRKKDACDAVAEAIRATGADAIALPCHVGSKDELHALVNSALRRWSGIDVLVCNAATNPAFGPLSEITDDAYDKVMDTNVRSTLWLCNMVLPQMAERGGGAVIIVSSIAALNGTDKIGAYGMSKAAEAALARNLAVEWGPRGIRVNAIAPGVVRTDFARALWEDPERRRHFETQNPLRRFGEPDDIGGVAVFLASDAASYVTGQTIVVDGGETIAGGRL
jgi:NAD(P)-dependent dehydrogenase (short-subunit alcohol dehydrogenase family)